MSIIVFTEHLEGKLKKQSYEIVSYAAQLADKISQKVVAVAVGEISREALERLSKLGANKIIHCPNPGADTLENQVYTRLLAEIFEKESGEILILANSFTGKAIAPRLSVRLKAGLVSGVEDLPKSTDPFVVKKKIFNGKAYAYEDILTPTKILSLNGNACEVIEKPVDSEWEEFSSSEAASAPKAEVLDVNKMAAENLLTEASIVVSGGRGMKGPDKWKPLEELASVLNGATACSKPVSDEGWRPHEEHVGQTGKTIAPDLYIAVGISGAVQHIAGVSGSKTIVAINADNEAPIFEIADYGIVGDAHEILPGFIQSVSKLD